MVRFDIKTKVKMKIKSVKSQITMLMIVGLMLFITLSFILYLSKSSVKRQSQPSIKKAQETAIDVQPIKEFVTKCLDKLAKDAVVLLGKQGGYIYKSQGGTLIDYGETDKGLFFVKHNNFNVAYDIKMPPIYSVFPYSSEIPDYPWFSFPYRTPESETKNFEGLFGRDDIPPLTPSGGSHSIQAQIEAYIDDNMHQCADFSIFEEQGFDIAMQPSKTSVIIGSNDLSIKSKIPLTITNPTTKEFAEISDFSTTMNIRLRDIYFFIKELIENDIENIKFDIGNAANNRDSISVSLIKDVYPNDDLIVVSDEKSLVYGKQFEYVFARKNRAPALYYIKNTDNLEFENGHLITESDLLGSQQKKAEDPDEDSYVFTITPTLPRVLGTPQIKFRVEVSDGKLSDYQDIIVKRLPIT